MRAIITLCLISMIFCLMTPSEAGYKKPPFNGSIFGKRGYNEYESSGKAMSALCDIAFETCQAWYQAMENKK